MQFRCSKSARKLVCASFINDRQNGLPDPGGKVHSRTKSVGLLFQVMYHTYVPGAQDFSWPGTLEAVQPPPRFEGVCYKVTGNGTVKDHPPLAARAAYSRTWVPNPTPTPTPAGLYTDGSPPSLTQCLVLSGACLIFPLLSLGSGCFFSPIKVIL